MVTERLARLEHLLDLVVAGSGCLICVVQRDKKTGTLTHLSGCLAGRLLAEREPR